MVDVVVMAKHNKNRYLLEITNKVFRQYMDGGHYLTYRQLATDIIQNDKPNLRKSNNHLEQTIRFVANKLIR